MSTYLWLGTIIRVELHLMSLDRQKLCLRTWNTCKVRRRTVQVYLSTVFTPACSPSAGLITLWFCEHSEVHAFPFGSGVEHHVIWHFPIALCPTAVCDHVSFNFVSRRLCFLSLSHSFISLSFSQPPTQMLVDHAPVLSQLTCLTPNTQQAN